MRARNATAYTIQPVSRAGWWLVVGYAAAIALSTPLLLLGAVGLIAFLTVAALATIVFVVTALRTSVSQAEWDRHKATGTGRRRG